MKLRRLMTVLALVLSLTTFLALAGVASANDTLTIQLNEQNNSGQSGMAELMDMGDGMTKVVITIRSGAAGVAQPAHIHMGTCATLDTAPKYPLTNVMNGHSETMVKVSLSELMAMPHAINIHKSAAEASVYVSCGNIIASKGGAGMTTTARTTTAAPGKAGAMTTTARTTTMAGMPRTGGGSMGEQSAPLLWATGAGLLALTAAGAAYALRRRQI
ncbi:MAG: hypothetical protein M3Q65_02780 [Chloroflexota bacterium]|nr:hypothetical protein [Chloroflexota bacterium]